jgi:hypothetical protein
MFLTADKKIIGMFIIYLHAEFHIPISSGPLVAVAERKAK